MSQKATSPTNIDTDLLALARAAVRIVQRKTGRRYTLAQFFREATIAQLRQVSRDYNDGRPITPDETPLPPGRPA
ncbi:hypothetical protein AXK56_16640 [Tsukamurella pulmonis]|uniref:50S ribosomal protein L7ae n=1 Tax=Tsukamurella pulmonis TaxID=47312 RepID=A0A1H1AAR6_9ACTN|nr:hypothetical protein [Tsukamurella pulmonis]KXO95837.1 hypothetical protein AXK56_16640 [Tsukamurella pulmonis]SDQ36818.1 hypothetical protein SAMN04489765_0137 [Tsukamurella pulmonis]SUQ39400.1 Uncharacterised protein [Tsukamurella pulmonis]